MAERSLRGSRLGALSMETDENVVPSERQITSYLCPQGHLIELPFSVEADIPATCGVSRKSTHGHGFNEREDGERHDEFRRDEGQGSCIHGADEREDREQEGEFR